MFGSLPTTVRTPLRRPTSRRGVVNLVELAAAEMIDWLLGAGRGWGWWSPACRRMRGSATRWRSSATACDCITASH